MINLDELSLYLLVGRQNSNFIDGIQLYDQFLIHMTYLKKLTFNIETTVWNKGVQVELQSYEDIQRSFYGRNYQEVASFVISPRFPCDGRCHIYSLPYNFEYSFDIDNGFHGGKFDKVRQLKMCDKTPFKRKLFDLISHDFPSLAFLSIINSEPMNDNDEPSTSITFPHLSFLDLQDAHVHYAEMFLLEKNIRLPGLVNLRICYESLVMITNNFNSDPTHFNFRTLKSLDLCQSFVRPKKFHQYFPLL